MSHLQQSSTKLRDHENNGGFMDTSQQQSSSTSTKSFVGKVRSTLSKWFNTPSNRNKVAVRPRNAMEANDSSNNDSNDDSEDDLIEQQKQPKIVLPPAKRLKAMTATSNEFTNIYANNNTQLRLFSQVGERNPKRLILNRRSNAVKLMQRTQDNTRESDSDGSTGGYFSMSCIAQGHEPDETDVNGQEEDSTSARVPSSSTMINPHNRSLFDTSHDRSLFTNLQSTVNTSLRKVSDTARPVSLSMRRPAFSGANLTNTPNVETTNNSGSLLDRTIATRRIYNSPFYSGRTLYGGASNRTIGRLRLPHHVNNAAVVETSRETDATSSTMLSSTARRILDTLESYTLDSTQRKLINQSTNRRQLSQDHLFRTHKPYNRAIPNDNNPCKLDDLQVPNVAQLLKMKERLQIQTVQVRQMIKESNLRQTSDTGGGGCGAGVGGKMRTKVTAQVRQRKQLHDTEPTTENDSAELERLSSIQLPIRALPKFTDLQLPLSKLVTLSSSGSANTIGITVTTVLPGTAMTTSATSSDSAAPTTTHCKYSAISDTKVTATVTPMTAIGSTTLKPIIDKKRDDQIFVFAKPLVLLDSGLNGSKVRNITAINNFKFSVPLNQKLIHKLKHQKKSSADNVDSTENNQIVTKPLLSQTIVASVASSSENKSSSSILQPTTTTTTAPGFGNSFKLSASSQWECDVCLVRNPSTALMCLACTSPKVQQMDTIAPVSTVAAAKAANVATSSIGWGGTIFQPPSNKWECPMCLVSNSNCSTRCVACETLKSGDSSAIKTATTTSSASAATWECPSCMVKNLTSVHKCVCCETLKPGSNIGNTGSNSLATNMFTFGIPPTAPAATSTTITVSDDFTFGLPPPKSLATVQTTSSVISTTTSAASVSVATVVDSKQQNSTTLTGFTFGIPATTAPATITINSGSGGNSSSAVSSTTTLNQKPLPNGMISSSSSSATPSVQTPVNAAVAIKFGVPTTTASGLFAFGRPATFTPSPVAVGQHVSSSTSTINDSNKAHVSPLETNSASGFSSSGAVSSTAAVANSGGFQAPAKTFAANPTIQAFPAFPIGNKDQLSVAPIPTSTILQTAAVTINASQAPVFSFGSATASTSNSAPSNGPFVFGGGSATSAASVAVQPPAAPTGLFSFRSATMTTAPNVTPSGFGFGAAAAAAPAAISFGGTAASNIFGQPKMNNGSFDFSSSVGAGKPFQVVSASSAPAMPSSGGFNFAPQNAVTPVSGGFFSFGSTAPVGSGSNNAAPSVVAAAAPFTFGTVSSSSSSAGTNGANKPTGAPLSFGGITSSSTPTIPPPAPRTNMFGTPTLSVASLAVNSANGGSQVLQQRRIIRKAVRRTNTQPR